MGEGNSRGGQGMSMEPRKLGRSVSTTYCRVLYYSTDVLYVYCIHLTLLVWRADLIDVS